MFSLAGFTGLLIEVVSLTKENKMDTNNVIDFPKPQDPNKEIAKLFGRMLVVRTLTAVTLSVGAVLLTRALDKKEADKNTI
jgi:hypothetical protein